MNNSMMQSIECTASIDEQGQLRLDQPLSVGKHDRVRVIVLFSEDVLPEDESNESIAAGLRRSLQEFREGQSIPLANLWDGMDVE
jgi:hypothetical protein